MTAAKRHKWKIEKRGLQIFVKVGDEFMPFGEWVDAAYAAAKLGAKCWLKDTEWGDDCDCADCQRHNRGGWAYHGGSGY
jgi:hypothetical protein